MSTKSYIIYEDEAGVFNWRYHHYDGQIHSLGETLYSNFSEKEDIKFLFEINRNFSTIVITRKQDEQLIEDEDYKRMDMNHKKIHYKDLLIRAYKDEKPTEIATQQFQSYADLSKQLNEEYMYYYPQKKKEWFVKIENSNYVPLKLACSISLLNEYIAESKNINFSQFNNTFRKKFLTIIKKIEKSSYRDDFYSLINNKFRSFKRFKQDALSLIYKDAFEDDFRNSEANKNIVV